MPMVLRESRVDVEAPGWRVRWDPLDVIAVGATLAALILVLGIVVGAVPLSNAVVALLLGLVGTTAVSAYAGHRGREPGKERPGS